MRGGSRAHPARMDDWRRGCARRQCRGRWSANTRRLRRHWDRNRIAPARHRGLPLLSCRRAVAPPCSVDPCQPPRGRARPTPPTLDRRAYRRAVAGCHKPQAPIPKLQSVHTQVPLELPLAHLSDVLLPFFALGLDEPLVDVRAERVPNDGILLQRIERLVQVARQLVDAVPPPLAEAHFKD